MQDAAPRLTSLAEQLLGAPFPLRIRAWDGSEAGPPGAPALVVRNRRALRRLLWRPGELGLARAWVAGDLDIEGDLYAALDLLAGLVWERGDGRARARAQALRDPEVRAAAPRPACALAGPPLPPAPPAEEVAQTAPAACTPGAATGGPSATTTTSATTSTRWSSARRWSTPAPTGRGRRHPGGRPARQARTGLPQARPEARSAAAGRRLRLGLDGPPRRPRARRVRASASPSPHEQAAYARKRVAEEGLTDRIEIRVQDYRDVTDGPYDAISSIGMAEHVGRERYLEYAEVLLRAAPARRPAAQPPDRPPPAARRVGLRHRRVHRRLRLPRRRTGARSARP